VNILFVNYGDFTTNSLNHIGGFANTLVDSGHACIVAIHGNRETLSAISAPRFIPATHAEVLAGAVTFPDGRPADVLHAWTPRECVRKFILEHQRRHPGTRVIIHLEDNEDALLEAFGGKSAAELRELPQQKFPFPMVDGLSHPIRSRNLLRLADAATVIVARLTEHVPTELPTHLLEPGVDFSLYQPQAADPKVRRELGLKEGERVVVFTGSVTFANAAETAELYRAIALLNRTGTPTRLIRTGFTHPDFSSRFDFDPSAFTLDLGFIAKARLSQLLALADVLVQPGRAGPFDDYRLPSKLPEFLSMGKPVVLPATNIGLELRDGEDALLLHEGSAEEIARVCRRVFADSELADHLAKSSVAFARKRFDLPANTGKLLQFYQGVLRAPPSPLWAHLEPEATDELPLLVRKLQTQFAASPPTTPGQAREACGVLDDLARGLRQLDHDLWEAGDTIANLRRHATGLEQTRETLTKDIADVRAHAAEHARQLEASTRGLQTHLDNWTNHARELEKAKAILTDQIAEVRVHAAEHARQLETALEQSETRAKNLKTDLDNWMSHARRLEDLRATLLKEISDVRASAEQHARQLDAEIRRLDADNQRISAAAVTGLQKARAVCEQAEREVADLQDRLYESEYRVQRMQATFSWRSTAWLRALRRALVDRWFGPPQPPPPPPRPERPIRFSPGDLSLLAPAPTLHSHLDAPRQWPIEARELSIRGWVVPETGVIVAVRARVAGRLYPGDYGLLRPDVGYNFKHLPAAGASGFRIVVALAETDGQIDLEVQDGEQRWHVFHRQPLGADQQLLARGSYAHWLKEFDSLAADQLEKLRERAAALSDPPLITILMPVYNTPERWLVRALDSIRAQVYPHWELCVADDASPAPHVRAVLERYAEEDARIKPIFRAQNGHISTASNSALAAATGEFCALMDHDDELSPRALLHIAEKIIAHPDAELVYTDEDKIDESGCRFDPHFKPDWNPDLLLSQNYISHLAVYRTATLREIGGFRLGFEGAQDWDVTLRVIERTTAEHIHHIPHVLYHWRAIEGSTAMHLQEKDYTVQAGRRALEEYFVRRNEPVALHLARGQHWHVRRSRPEPPPLVTLVIPTRNRRELLVTCVESLFAQTAYPRFEILVADNDSDDPELFAFYEKRKALGRFAVLPCPGPFNFSAINNRAVAHARGELIGLLNNDLEAIHPEWLDEMVAHAVRPEIGCVGAKLYYPDLRIQHAGVITGLGGVAGHPFKGFTRDEPGTPQFRPHLVQNLSAVTAACLLIRKSVYQQAGGFEEAGLTIAFNDVDFCLKVQALGYRNLFTPFAELIHHESASRGSEDTPEKIRRFQQEIEFIQKKWGAQLHEDRAYNPNLTLASEDFGLAYPPRTNAILTTV
jgi:GT2 family glycosyltransferase/glycosyltransferase involved in cell wall biosynthesis